MHAGVRGALFSVTGVGLFVLGVFADRKLRTAHAMAVAQPASQVAQAGSEARPGISLEERLGAAVSRHYAEPLDTAWAEPEARAFAAGLSPLGVKLGFELKGVNCRSTTCIAEVRWRDRSLVSAGAQAILGAAYADTGSCARAILTGDLHSDAGDDIRSQLIFDCGGERSPKKTSE